MIGDSSIEIARWGSRRILCPSLESLSLSSRLTFVASTLGNCKDDGWLRFRRAKELSLLLKGVGVPLGVMVTEKTSSLYLDREVSVRRKQLLGCVIIITGQSLKNRSTDLSPKKFSPSYDIFLAVFTKR